MSKSRFLIGADPELFLSQADGKIISVIGKLGGTKDAPVPVEELGKGFAYQEDNVLVEYNIPAADCQESFVVYNARMLDFLRKKVAREHNAKLVIKASHVMDDDQLEHPLAHVFGCEPDFNVWTVEDNPRPQCDNPALRSAGGHVHVGLKMGKMDKIAFGRLLDAGLGLWSVTVDKDTQRRQLYGKAGSIRFKPYGIEYRTLSNFWIASNSLQQMVYNYVTAAVQMFNDRNFRFVEKYGADIMKAINTSDKDKAASMLADFR